jgi:hypothetical protein
VIGTLASPRELLGNVATAARAIRPRTFVDPREGARYWTNLTTSLIKLQGGLLLRTMITEGAVQEDEPLAMVRSIA